MIVIIQTHIYTHIHTFITVLTYLQCVWLYNFHEHAHAHTYTYTYIKINQILVFGYHCHYCHWAWCPSPARTRSASSAVCAAGSAPRGWTCCASAGSSRTSLASWATATGRPTSYCLPSRPTTCAPPAWTKHSHACSSASLSPPAATTIWIDRIALPTSATPAIWSCGVSAPISLTCCVPALACELNSHSPVPSAHWWPYWWSPLYLWHSSRPVPLQFGINW